MPLSAALRKGLSFRAETQCFNQAYQQFQYCWIHQQPVRLNDSKSPGPLQINSKLNSANCIKTHGVFLIWVSPTVCHDLKSLTAESERSLTICAHSLLQSLLITFSKPTCDCANKGIVYSRALNLPLLLIHEVCTGEYIIYFIHCDVQIWIPLLRDKWRWNTLLPWSGMNFAHLPRHPKDTREKFWRKLAFSQASWRGNQVVELNEVQGAN